uniref:RING-type domain-containing protein n=1 Tax=Trichuris muris TaxID=70415 RepID=A0A5S6R1W3_TRIMR
MSNSKADDLELQTTQLEEDEEDTALSAPKFKYRRLLNDLTDLFREDAASCIAVHDRFIVLGTQWVAVNHISVDNAGEYLASCANDGKVVICGLFGSEHSRVVTMDRPIRSVAIHPEFSRGSLCQQFVTGDRVLVLHERNLFSKYKQQLLFIGKERDGHIHNISWRGCLIAFANETGVLVYDKNAKTLLTHVTRRHELTWRCELLPAHICWFDDNNFMIGWANTLTICSVNNTPSTLSLIDLPGRLVEVRHMWELPEHLITGLSYTPCQYTEATVGSRCQQVKRRWQEIILFTVSMRNQSNFLHVDNTEPVKRDVTENADQSECPRVTLLEAISFQEFATISEDIIKMKDCPSLSCHQYHFIGLPNDNSYYLLSTRDLIQMKCCSNDDRVGWMLSKGLFNKAMDFANEHAHELTKYCPVSVGRQYLQHLLQSGQYAEAAVVCHLVCGRMKDMWEYYVTRFEQVGQLIHLVDVLPTQFPQLEPECYQCVLMELLNKDIPHFKHMVSQWSPDLYRVSALVIEVVKRLQKGQLATPLHRDLLSVLAQLYAYEHRFEPAIEIYLKLNDRSIFALIERSKLFHLVKDRIHQLIAVDADLAIRLLLENEDSLSPSTVMKQLIRLPKLQLAYLERLFARGQGDEFADIAVLLYAEHNRPRLLQFLRDCEHYTLDKALEVCRQRHFTPETVFLLGKSGNRREALKVIITDMRDIRRAIDFCVDLDDSDLWLDLIEYSVMRPDFLVVLMQYVGMHVDPKLIIDQIPTDVKVPQLKKALVKLLLDHCIKMNIEKNCRKITLSDCHRLLTEYMDRCKSQTVIAGKDECVICQENLVDPYFHQSRELIVFNCHHVFHLKCLREQRKCPVCSS